MLQVYGMDGHHEEGGGRCKGMTATRCKAWAVCFRVKAWGAVLLRTTDNRRSTKTRRFLADGLRRREVNEAPEPRQGKAIQPFQGIVNFVKEKKRSITARFANRRLYNPARRQITMIGDSKGEFRWTRKACQIRRSHD